VIRLAISIEQKQLLCIFL